MLLVFDIVCLLGLSLEFCAFSGDEGQRAYVKIKVSKDPLIPR